MKTLRIPNRSVRPEDFRGILAVCQNLDCLAPIEPPFPLVQLAFPTGTLATVLCSHCLPPNWEGEFREMCIELEAVKPLLALPDPEEERSSQVPGFIALSEVKPGRVPRFPPPELADRDPPTFAELARLEPRLLDLLAEARGHHDDPKPDFCANAFWYGYPGYRPGLKSRLCRLVGMFAEKGGMLLSSKAYDVAYHTIYQALPDCRGRCACTFGFSTR